MWTCGPRNTVGGTKIRPRKVSLGRDIEVREREFNFRSTWERGRCCVFGGGGGGVGRNEAI